MAILKCKMCGGSLESIEGSAVVVCEYCGTKQTIPLLDDEKKIQLFERANSYRTNCEFDKASLLYEEILSEYPDNAEAHWGVCLCKYGIEYVDDRLKGKRTPTCHRTQFKSILEDADYLAAINNSESSAREIYQSEAEYIDTVQRKILAISAKEDPFDIFICYKESDQNGDRTKDSVIAQEIYNDLTEMGYKVFFSRITLEDKLGIAYEPYIFAALNSAPLMLIVGTSPEHFNAVWVKNEWSRYLHMIEQGQKKTVVPCYRDMSASQLPIEFSVLQGQDVSKIGWKQDLLRGIGKILPLEKAKEEPKREKTPPKKESVAEGYYISAIRCIGAQNADDCWPNEPTSTIFNTNIYPCISFQALMRKPFKEYAVVNLKFKVADPYGNIVCNIENAIRVAPGNDKLAQVWIIKGDDGTVVQAGQYRVTMQIDDWNEVSYNFKIVDVPIKSSTTNQEAFNYKTEQPKSKKSLSVYTALALLLGTVGAHSFYAGQIIKGIMSIVLFFAGVGALSAEDTTSTASLFIFILAWPLLDAVIALVRRRVPSPKNKK